MKRQLDDYISRFYMPEAERSAKLKANDFAKAREIVAWKENFASKWNQVHVISTDFDGAVTGTLHTGSTIDIKAVIDTKGLGDSLGVELVSYIEKDGESHFAGRQDLKVVNREGDVYTYELKDKVKKAGIFRYALRMYPKNEALPHRQDFAYVRWF